MRSAIATGYRKGIATIIDANVITLITAFILFVARDGGRQGLRLHPRRRDDRLAVHRGRLHPGLPRGCSDAARFMRSPSLLGAGTEERVRWHFDFSGAEQVLLLALGRDPADRRASPSRPCSSTSGSTSSRAAGSPSGSQQDADRRGRARPRSTASGSRDAEITEAHERRARPNVFQIESDIEPEQVREIQPALEDSFGLVENGFNSTTVGPTFGQQVATQRHLRDHLLAAGDLRLRRVPLRAEVRDPGDHRRDPRHPDHGGRLLPGREGGDQRDRRGLPDDPRLLALRHASSSSTGFARTCRACRARPSPRSSTAR